MQAPGQSPSYLLGQGTDPSHYGYVCHSKSCLCCGSLFVASSAIPDRKRTTDDPIAHFPRLSFRTSFSFSPFGFSSVAFVTRYQPVAQSLFHTLSHQGRLGGTCHWVGGWARTRKKKTTYVLMYVQPPVGLGCAYFMRYAVGHDTRHYGASSLQHMNYTPHPTSLETSGAGTCARPPSWQRGHFHLPLYATALPTARLPPMRHCGPSHRIHPARHARPSPPPSVGTVQCLRSEARGQLELDPCPGFRGPTVTSPKLRNVLIGTFSRWHGVSSPLVGDHD